MGLNIWEGNKAQELLDLLRHQNAAIDLLASDKRAALATNVADIATLINNGELLEVMDYGDKITIPWNERTTAYSPQLNLCHIQNGILEDGETIPVARFEWDKATPIGMPFDAPEAIFSSDSVLVAGTYYFKVVNDSWGGNDNKYISFTLPEDLPVGYQIRKSVSYNVDVLTGTLDVYSSGASLTKEYSMTPTEGQTGMYLGETDGTDDLQHWHRVALGSNRWLYSNLRQYLNATATAGNWWVQQHKWDVKPSQADTYDGFLAGYDEDVIQYFKPIKRQTVASNIDNNVIDITYDRVSLTSLEEMYCVPQFAGSEGDYWEYYKRLLGASSPVATSQTYTRLIKYALNNPTSPQYCFRRSASRSGGSVVWSVFSSGGVYAHGASGAFRCAPEVAIGD